MFRQATVRLRPEAPEDRDFLQELYLSTRDDEAGYRELPPAERNARLIQQFDWQHEHYRKAFPQAWFTIIMVDEWPAGRLYLARRPRAFLLVDLSLLPAFRGHGIGSQLVRNVQAEAAREQLPIRLSVVADNPAHRFYRRLGFEVVAREAVRLRLEWRPPAAGS